MRAFLQRACRDAFVMKTEVDLCSSRARTQPGSLPRGCVNGRNVTRTPG